MPQAVPRPKLRPISPMKKQQKPIRSCCHKSNYLTLFTLSRRSSTRRHMDTKKVMMK